MQRYNTLKELINEDIAEEIELYKQDLNELSEKKEVTEKDFASPICLIRDSEVNVNTQDNNGNTLAHIMITALLKNHKEPNFENLCDRRFTTLGILVKKYPANIDCDRQFTTLGTLVKKHPANIDIKNNNNKTCMQLIMNCEEIPAALKIKLCFLCINLGASVSNTDIYDNTILHLIMQVESFSKKFESYLLKIQDKLTHQDFHARNMEGKCFFYEAIAREDLKMLELYGKCKEEKRLAMHVLAYSLLFGESKILTMLFSSRRILLNLAQHSEENTYLLDLLQLYIEKKTLLTKNFLLIKAGAAVKEYEEKSTKLEASLAKIHISLPKSDFFHWTKYYINCGTITKQEKYKLVSKLVKSCKEQYGLELIKKHELARLCFADNPSNMIVTSHPHSARCIADKYREPETLAYKKLLDTGFNERQLALLLVFINHMQVDINTQNEKGETLLHLLTSNNVVPPYSYDKTPGKYDATIKDLLAKSKADTNIPDKNGKTAFSNQLDIVQNRSLVNTNIDIIYFFLDRQADINTKDKDENTFLHRLTIEYTKWNSYHDSKNEESYDSLIEKCVTKYKADLSITNKSGLTALQIIMNSYMGNYQKIPTIMQFLKLGADASSKDKQDNSIPHILFADAKDRSNEITTLFNTPSFNVAILYQNNKERAPTSPLDLVVTQNKAAYLRLMKQLKLDSEKVTQAYKHMAAITSEEKLDPDTISALDELGVDLNVDGCLDNILDKLMSRIISKKDTDLLNKIFIPLIKAHGTKETLNRLLISAMQQLDAIDHWQRYSKDYPHILYVLLKHGADQNIKDKKGNTALHFLMRSSGEFTSDQLDELLNLPSFKPYMISSENNDFSTPFRQATRHSSSAYLHSLTQYKERIRRKLNVYAYTISKSEDEVFPILASNKHLAKTNVYFLQVLQYLYQIKKGLVPEVTMQEIIDRYRSDEFHAYEVSLSDICNLFSGSEKLKKVYNLIEIGVNPDIKAWDYTCSNSTLLHILASNNNYDWHKGCYPYKKTIKELVEKYHADIHALDGKNDTPLTRTFTTNIDDATLSLLLSLGANKEDISSRNETLVHAIYRAAIDDANSQKRYNTCASYQSLIQKYQINIDMINRDRLSTLQCVMNDASITIDLKLKLIISLIDAGANIHTRDSKGNSILHLLREEDVQLLERLLAAGVDINTQNNNGDTLAHLATSINFICKLMDKGANIHIKNTKGESVLDTANNQGLDVEPLKKHEESRKESIKVLILNIVLSTNDTFLKKLMLSGIKAEILYHYFGDLLVAYKDDAITNLQDTLTLLRANCAMEAYEEAYKKENLDKFADYAFIAIADNDKYSPLYSPAYKKESQCFFIMNKPFVNDKSLLKRQRAELVTQSINVLVEQKVEDSGTALLKKFHLFNTTNNSVQNNHNGIKNKSGKTL